MEKEFVSYDIAVALKELGFDEECMANGMGFAYDFKDGEYITSHEQIFYPNDSITPDDLAEELDRHPVHICGIPLKQQVFRWFRKPQNGSYNHLDFMYEYLKDDSVTYEEAENACIDKLLELAKQQDNGN